MLKQDYIGFLHMIPEITSNVIYQYMGQNSGKVPRFPSVLKIVKDDCPHYLGCKFKDLGVSQQSEIEATVKDVFYGIKEAGF